MCQNYIDGNGVVSESRKPAWAAVVVVVEVYSCGSYKCCGFVNGVVVTDEQHPHYVGMTKATVGSAELSAQIWASLFILQSEYRVVEVLYDSKFAENVTSAVS